MTRIRQAVLAVLLVAGLAVTASAQQSVTQADIQRLQDNVYQAGNDVQQLRARDSGRASQLQSDLDDLRDEVVYLKVKLRKERTLARSEYADVRDRIEDLRSRARNDGAATSTPVTPPPAARSSQPARTAAGAGSREVPTGTEIDVRLQNTLNSGTAMVEDRFEGTTLADVIVDGRTLIPAGSIMRGVVTAVEPAGRLNRTAKMTVSFDQVTINGRAYPMRGTVTQAIEGEGIKGDAGKAGVGAGVGAVLGAVLGGVKGAVLGAVIGGGGTIAATEGKQVDLPQGSVLRVRIDSPLTVGTAAR